MTAIVLEKDGVIIRSVKVNKECMRLGRRQGNDCVISDSSVSGFHAEIHTTTSGCYIKDLSSTNGTFVNDRLVSIMRIYPTDTIRLGNSTLRLDFSDQLKPAEYIEPEPAPEHLKPHVSGEDWLGSLSLSLNESDAPENAPSKKAKVNKLKSAFQKKDKKPETIKQNIEEEDLLDLGVSDEWHEVDNHWAMLIIRTASSSQDKKVLLNKAQTKIGSSQKCVISITYDVSGYWLECLHGPDLPLLNGAICQERELYRLFDGDQLSVVSSRITFSWPD